MAYLAYFHVTSVFSQLNIFGITVSLRHPPRLTRAECLSTEVKFMKKNYSVYLMQLPVGDIVLTTN